MKTLQKGKSNEEAHSTLTKRTKGSRLEGCVPQQKNKYVELILEV